MGLFGKLIETGFDVVTAPIEVAKDVVTLGGALTGKDEPYSLTRVKEIVDDADDILDEVRYP